MGEAGHDGGAEGEVGLGAAGGGVGDGRGRHGLVLMMGWRVDE